MTHRPRDGHFPAPVSPAQEFSETAAWQPVGSGWRQLFGNFRGEGLSFEWHDFEASDELDWSRSFHPSSVELCLNLAGEGHITHQGNQTVVGPRTAAFYSAGADPLFAARRAGQRHQFLTVEFRFDFIKNHLSEFTDALHGHVRAVAAGNRTDSWTSGAIRLSARQQSLLQSLREPPVLAAAQPLWYRTKALELASEYFFSSNDQELFCQRQQRVAADRVQRVMAMIQQDLSNPPTLEDLGKAIGCSPFHLSRTFSSETGMSIPHYTRRLRMERAAELLTGGKLNVTEVAYAVGYSSLSHFSTTFHQTFGCCPGLYPIGAKNRR